MIIDRIENLEKYASVHPRFERAFAFLNELMEKGVADGRYACPDTEIADEIYVSLGTNTVAQKTEAVAESHRKYIDVQVVFEGDEEMFVPALVSPAASTEYDAVKDFELYEAVALGDCHGIKISAGNFVIFFENELHAPCGAIEGKSTTVRKAVLKVLA